MEQNKIPPPRGEPFKFLGMRPNQRDLEWIMKHVGLPKFREEVEKTLGTLPKPGMVGHWAKVLEDVDNLGKEIRTTVYGLLMKRIPMHHYEELINDHHEFEEDTFLAVLDSHVRYFLVLIPEIAERVQQYDSLLSRFESLNQSLAAELQKQLGWPPGITDVRTIILQKTVNRLRSKGGSHE